MAAPLVHTLCKTRQIYATFARTLRKKVCRVAACTYSSEARDAWTVSGRSGPIGEDRVLHFFNECDQASLRHLIDLDEKLFGDVDASSILKRGPKGDRFNNIESLMEVVMPEGPKLFGQLDQALNALNQTLHSNFMIKGLPWITNKTVENVDKVVSIEITQRDVAWSEQTSDRTVASLNQVRLFEDIFFNHVRTELEFDHVEYQDQVVKLVPQIPESKVYMIYQNSYSTISQGSPTRCHLALLESLIITLLNMRHNPKHGNIGNTLFRNKVYSLTGGHLAGYYGYQYPTQLGQSKWMVERAMVQEPGPLDGLKMSEQAVEAFSSRPDTELMTKCILMSDMLWQVKNRWDKQHMW